MTRDEIKKLLKLISSTWINFKWDTESVDAWEFAFDDISGADAGKAFKIFLKTSKTAFPPTPPELIRIVNELNLPPQLKITPEEAWDQKQTNPLAAEAYRLWGGEKRRGAMVDPSWTGNHKDQVTVDFAMKHFYELFQNVCDAMKAKEAQGICYEIQLIEMAEQNVPSVVEYYKKKLEAKEAGKIELLN